MCVSVCERVSAARERKLIKILRLSKAKLVRRMMPRPVATPNLNTFIAAPQFCVYHPPLWNSFKAPKVQRRWWQMRLPPGNRNIVNAGCPLPTPKHTSLFLSVNLESIHI